MFYKSLERFRPAEEEGQDDGDADEDNQVVHYDEIDSSKTIHETIADVLGRTPTGLPCRYLCR